MTTQTPEQVQVGGTEPVTALAVVRESSVDRVSGVHVVVNLEHAWYVAHHGSAILDHAETYLRTSIPDRWKRNGWEATGDAQLILKNARTDLRAVMEYLDGLTRLIPGVSVNY